MEKIFEEYESFLQTALDNDGNYMYIETLLENKAKKDYYDKFKNIVDTMLISLSYAVKKRNQ